MLVAGNLFFGVTGLLIPLAVLVPDYAFPLVIVCEFLQYLGLMPFFLNTISLIQLQSPDQMRGRMMSTRKFLTWGVQPFGSLTGGILGGLITVPWTLAAGKSACWRSGSGSACNRSVTAHDSPLEESVNARLI